MPQILPGELSYFCGLCYCACRGKVKGGGKGAPGERFLPTQLTAHLSLFTLPSPPGTAAEYSLYFRTLNIKYMRMGDLIVRTIVIPL